MQEDSVEEGNARQMFVRRKIDFGNRRSNQIQSDLTTDEGWTVLVLRTAFLHLIWLLKLLLAQKGAPALPQFLLGTIACVCVCVCVCSLQD